MYISSSLVTISDSNVTMETKSRMENNEAEANVGNEVEDMALLDTSRVETLLENPGRLLPEDWKCTECRAFQVDQGFDYCNASFDQFFEEVRSEGGQINVEGVVNITIGNGTFTDGTEILVAALKENNDEVLTVVNGTELETADVAPVTVVVAVQTEVKDGSSMDVTLPVTDETFLDQYEEANGEFYLVLLNFGGLEAPFKSVKHINYKKN